MAGLNLEAGSIEDYDRTFPQRHLLNVVGGACSGKADGKPVPGGVAFNEKHPLTLESRAGVWNKDREI